MFGLGCTKTWGPKISTVLHWRPPSVHIFYTDPSLVYIAELIILTQRFTKKKSFDHETQC